MIWSYLTLPILFRIGMTVLVGLIISKCIGKRKKRRIVGYVSSLRTHPVKSCRPVHLEKTDVTSLGLKHDRQYCLVNQHGTLVTLRKYHKFVQINQEITDEGIVLTAEGMPPLKLPLSVKAEDGDHSSDINVFRLICPGVHVSAEADKWFEEYFNLEGCRLYCFPANGLPRYAADLGVKVPNYSNQQDSLMFADECPVLVLSEGSVDSMNQKSEEHFTADTFRPNIVVSECSAFAEESWGLIEIGSASFQALYPCGRCVALNVDPDKATVNENMLNEVKRLRPSTEAPFPQIKGCIFGMDYGVRKEGIISVGDPVYAVEGN